MKKYLKYNMKLEILNAERFCKNGNIEVKF